MTKPTSHPLCLVLMPSTADAGADGDRVDFDDVYRRLVEPALRDLQLEPIRADPTGGSTPFDRLLLCEYAIADATSGHPAVYCGIGARQVVRPRQTVLISADERAPALDTGPMGRLSYRLDADGRLADPAAERTKLTALLRAAGEGAPSGSLLDLLEGSRDPQPDHTRTDQFRRQVEYSTGLKQRLWRARTEGADAVAAVEAGLGALERVEAGVLVDLLLSYRAVEAWQRMLDLVERMPEPLRRAALVREQYAFALNRSGRGEEAESVLRDVLREFGASSETWGLLGRVYKDRWEAAKDAGREAAARGLLARAAEAYLEGFETDWRDAYPGINAITLMELMEPPDPGREALQPVVEYSARRRTAGESDYWDWATLLEARLLARDQAGARDALARALARMREPWEPATTVRNVRLIRQARERRGEDVMWHAEIENELGDARREAMPASPAPAPDDAPAVVTERPAEVLIVGTGLGGGVLGWALAESRVDVLQLERGEYRGSHPGNHSRYDGSAELGFGHDATPFADRLRDGALPVTSKGEFKPPLKPVFGGGTVAWGALSVRMQRYEFDPWPAVVRDQIMTRYYDAASERLRVRGVRFPADEAFLRLIQQTFSYHHPGPAPIAFGAGDDAPDSPRKFCSADPLWDLMHVARPDTRSRRYRLLPKHEAVRFRLDPSGKRVTGVEVRDLDGGRSHVLTADRYVLAAGPIESAAIAMRSGLAEDAYPGSPLVGRGLTDHPVYYRAFEIPYGSTFYEYHRYAKALALPSDDRAGSHPYNVVLHIGLVDRLRGHVTSGSRYGEVVFLLDARLDESNGVRLDGGGRPQVSIDPCPVPRDLHDEMAAQASRVIDDLKATPKNEVSAAPLMNVIHHVGSLRMGAGGSGVVDEDLRFRGVDNLYVCDGSVLPSSPAANPGLTIAALALRLGDHLLAV